MLDRNTQQFMYYAFIVLVCLVVLGSFGFVFAVAWREGDGEAVKIAGYFAPIAVSAFLSIGGVLGLHTVVGGSVAKATIANSAPASSADAGGTPAVALAASDL